MTAIIKIFALAFLQILICRNTKKQFGLILPVLCAIGSLSVIGSALINDISVSEPLFLLLALFNDYTIDFVLLMIIYAIYTGNSESSEQKTTASVAAEPIITEIETNESTASVNASSSKDMIAELKDGIATTKRIFKNKKFQEEVKDGIFGATTLTIGLMIGTALIGMTIMMFILMDNVGDSHKEQLAEDAKTTYNGYVYREFVPEEDTLWYTGEYVNLVNLEIKPLSYTCETRTGFDKPEKDYYLSTIDNIEAPTEEYTLSYHVCSNVDASYIDKAEQKFLDDFEGTPIEPQFDYGADTAYWLDDELLLRYGDNHLLYFYDDTTEELINNEETAAFMRDNMLLEKPFEKVNTLDYVFGKKGPKQE